MKGGLQTTNSASGQLARRADRWSIACTRAEGSGTGAPVVGEITVAVRSQAVTGAPSASIRGLVSSQASTASRHSIAPRAPGTGSGIACSPPLAICQRR